jgi:hypothetical protein
MKAASGKLTWPVCSTDNSRSTEGRSNIVIGDIPNNKLSWGNIAMPLTGVCLYI